MAEVQMPSAMEPFTEQRITVTGLTPNSSYTLIVDWASGHGRPVAFSTNHNGDAEVVVVPQHEHRGPVVARVFPPGVEELAAGEGRVS